MTGFGFAGGEGTRRHSWASRTSWTEGEYSLWAMHSGICSSAEFCAFPCKCQGKPLARHRGEHLAHGAPFPCHSGENPWLPLASPEETSSQQGDSYFAVFTFLTLLFCNCWLSWRWFGLLDWNHQELEDAGSVKGSPHITGFTWV